MTRRLVNLWQTAEERRAKYWLCRSLGANPSWATSMRDWRLSKIERKYNLPITNKMDSPLDQIDTLDHLYSKSRGVKQNS